MSGIFKKDGRPVTSKEWRDIQKTKIGLLAGRRRLHQRRLRPSATAVIHGFGGGLPLAD
jgi:hypothetical protein